MNNRKVLCFIAFSVIASTAFSQKLKYKDIFLLLSSRQYDQAEPFMKKYLKENDDNPNALLYMGIIFQEKTQKADVLKENENAVAWADSALLFLQKANTLITERELKRNDEYYQIYNRRDLRTGKFGVKLSDVQLDIEKRVEGLKDRRDKVAKAKHWLDKTGKLYSKAQDQYRGMIAPYTSAKQFYLRFNDSTVSHLETLADTGDSAVIAFNHYKSTLESLGRTGYNPNLVLVDVKRFAVDGLSSADLMKDDVPMWNYKGWANTAKKIMKEDIKPTREKLLLYDARINKLRDKIRKDSVSVADEVDNLWSAESFEALKKHDENPMPIALFSVKLSELEYASALIENEPTRDSINARLQLNNARQELSAAKKLDSLAGLLAARNIAEDAEDYDGFVTGAYGKADVLKSFIATTKDYAERELKKRQSDFAIRRKALDWLIVDKDSVPITPAVAEQSKYKPLFTQEEQYTAGLAFPDSLGTGYFYSITPSRVPDMQIKFPVDKTAFRKSQLPVSHALVATDTSGFIFIVAFYSDTKLKGKNVMSLAKIYRADGLAWSKNYQLDGIPFDLFLDSQTGQISMKVTSGTGNVAVVRIDKSGKQL